jgi:hypothetical protein
MGGHLSEKSYICGMETMEWRVKQIISAQQFTPVAVGIYEGQLVVWDVADAHNDVFTRQTKFHIYGDTPVYLQHNYFAPPVGKIVHFSERDDGLYVALKLERPIEAVNGIHLSVGGFAIGGVREDGNYEIKEFAVFEVSLTPTPAQPNSAITLLMKNLTDVATKTEKAPQEKASGQATQKVATQPSALGYKAVLETAGGQDSQKERPAPASAQATQKESPAPASAQRTSHAKGGNTAQRIRLFAETGFGAVRGLRQ